MTSIVEYVTKQEFDRIKRLFKDDVVRSDFRTNGDVTIWHNHEFPETLHIDFKIGKVGISIRYEIEDQ